MDILLGRRFFEISTSIHNKIKGLTSSAEGEKTSFRPRRTAYFDLMCLIGPENLEKLSEDLR